MSHTPNTCPLCLEAGGLLVHQTPQWRLIRVLDDANFPAFYRLIWQGPGTHIAEFSALSQAERSACMEAVATVERVLLEQLRPTKINLASLGNMVPHLHWHVIARFDWDSHFPNPVWGAAQREVAGGAEARLALPLAELDRLLAAAFKS
ncbi:HIT domain-containing protein [Paucibacter sp. KBW04]|uniref:HIT family protein n=1 Tax=Paucibacter sp. KBW04 TaxID=2153361 RepID=UPI000F55FFF7|nr:HIT family protein [Paucibacter sp. KBW04]RQO57204.1 HIT domain-containing protein [Paucibacter sp. KBW04]